MPPVLVLQALAGEKPEPEEERHRAVLVVFRQPPGRIEARLLDDIGRVNPPLQPPVEAQCDHATQPLAIPAQQLPESPLVPAQGLFDQMRRLAPVGYLSHGRHHIPITGRPAGLVTGKMCDETGRGGAGDPARTRGGRVRERGLPGSEGWRTAPRPSTWLWAMGEPHRRRM